MAEIFDFKAQLNKIRREWDKAEQSLKLAEQVGNQVVFPAIKELRYAGRRLVDAIALAPDGDPADMRALIDDALFNCYRARHDAVDAAISTIAAELDVTAKKLGYKAILAAYPKYSEFLLALSAAQRRIASSRGVRAERDQIYTAIENVELTTLIEHYRNFKACEEIMRGLARQDRVWPLSAIVVSVLFGLGGIILGIWRLLK